jgi:tetratricopeptide (TPR) repeat protein
MKPTNDLHELVQSLTKSEKRFFKLQSSLQSGEKNYVRIFDLLERMEVYDEEYVKEHFKGEVFLKHLPSEKNHLFKLILKALRSFHGEHSTSNLIKQELKNVEILFYKGLYLECKKALKRAKRMATDHEFFYYLFEIISWQKTLLEEDYENGDFSESIDDLSREEEEVLVRLRNLTEYQVLYGKVNAVFRLGGFTPSAVDEESIREMKNSLLISDETHAQSSRARCIRLYSLGFCAIAQNEIEKANHHFEQLLALFDECAWLKDDKAKRYLRTLGQYLTCKILLKDRQAAKQLYGRLEELAELPRFQSHDLHVFRTRMMKQLQIEMALFFDQSVNIEDLKSAIEEDSSYISKEFDMVFNYRLAMYEFANKNYQKAQKYVNYVINNAERDLRQDVYGHVRVLNVFIHLCLENHDLVDYALKSIIRFYSNRDRDHAAEVNFLKVLKQLNKKDRIERKDFIASGKLEEAFPAHKNMEDQLLFVTMKKGMN